MRTLLACICIVIPFFGMSQPYAKNYGEGNLGIHFESGLSWQDVLAKAKAEHKPIFMDCYASWCGPCKYMETVIYPNEKVGDFFNSHFINVKVQMDSTGRDSKDIQDWYRDAKFLLEKYQVVAFPSYLFFSADGQAIHKLIGASGSGEEFIDKAMAALDPNRQYYTLLANEPKNQEDSNFFLHVILAASDAGDREKARLFTNKYIACVKEPITKENVVLINTFMVSELDNGFGLFVENASKIDEVAGEKGFAEKALATVVFNDEIVPHYFGNKMIRWKEISNKIASKYSTLDKDPFEADLEQLFEIAIKKEIRKTINDSDKVEKLVDWTRLAKGLKERFPGYDCDRLFLPLEARYCFERKEWEECANAAIVWIDRYGKHMDVSVENDYIWRCIFLHSSNRDILERALKHMEFVVKTAPRDVDNLDTYANLLYKSGRKQEGIDWEKKAIDICKKKGSDITELMETLKKMENGEATWESESKS